MRIKSKTIQYRNNWAADDVHFRDNDEADHGRFDFVRLFCWR